MNTVWDGSHAFYNRLNSAKGAFENFNQSETSLIGHQLEDLVMFCRYRGVDCDYEQDFTRFVSPTFFNCYTYNVPENIVDTGPDKGLTMVLFLEIKLTDFDRQFDFTRDSHVEQTLGARVEIHEKGTLPNPLLNGINVQPGHHTDLVLKQSRRKKLGWPYSNCESRSTLSEISSYEYSTSGCLDVCKTMFVYEKCGCVNSDTPLPDSLRRRRQSDDVSYCGTFHNTSDAGLDELYAAVECEREALLDFTSDDCVADNNNELFFCDVPCAYNTYDVSTSQSIWPSLVALYDTYDDYVRGTKATTLLGDAAGAPYNSSNHAQLRDLMWHNLARVNIYFNEPQIVEIKEVASMSLLQLFANVGGAIGLWAGLSVITVLEFISLPCQLVHYYGQQRRKARNNVVKCSNLQ